MNDYISREALIKAVEGNPYVTDSVKSYVRCTAKSIPTVDAVPVVHGWWIQNDNGTWSCNRCHSWIPDEQHYYAQYCLYCGSKMDGGRKERQC